MAEEPGTPTPASLVPRRYPARDVKTLWGYAAGRCSFPGCRRVCIEPATTAGDQYAITGDIAHIYPHACAGPRGTVPVPDGLDPNSYDNWVLLCVTHHRQVDRQPKYFDVAFLVNAKRTHERWVEDRLGFGQFDRAATTPPQTTRVEATDVWRIFRQHQRPWEPPATTGRSRWDDPYNEFHVVYAARTARAALTQTLSGLQVPRALDDFPAPPETPPSADSPRASTFTQLPSAAEWVDTRRIAHGVVTNTRLADLRSRKPAANLAWGLNLTTLEPRETRSLARLLHSLRDSRGENRYDGIIYTSRTTDDDLLALFADRVCIDPVADQPLSEYLRRPDTV